MIQKLWIWVDGCFKIQFSFKESFTIIQKSVRFQALSPRKGKKKKSELQQKSLFAFQSQTQGKFTDSNFFLKMLTNNIWT